MVNVAGFPGIPQGAPGRGAPQGIFLDVLRPFRPLAGVRQHVCAEHADDHFCPTAAGQNFTLHSTHPKLNPLTPFGMYRSRQHYFGDDGKTVIGCVDMLVPYEK